MEGTTMSNYMYDQFVSLIADGWKARIAAHYNDALALLDDAAQIDGAIRELAMSTGRSAVSVRADVTGKLSSNV